MCGFNRSVFNASVLSILYGCAAISTLPAAQEESTDWTEITIHPRAVEEPFLGTRLFPDDFQREDGSAVAIILRLACERNNNAWERLEDNGSKYLNASSDEFSPEKAREEVPEWYVEELRRAAFKREADWEYALREEEEFFIPDVADTRQILRGLAVHCRADIAEGKIDAAIDKITTGLGVTAHLQGTPALLIKLIGAKNADLFLDRVQELVEHDESPNLYWALTAIPDPLIDLRSLVDWERKGKLRYAPLTENLDNIHSKAQWRQLRWRLSEYMPFSSGGFSGYSLDEKDFLRVDLEKAKKELPLLDPSTADRVGTMSVDELKMRYHVARYLEPFLGHGVDVMSDDELTVRYYVARYQCEVDRVVRALLLPPHEALPLLRASSDHLEEEENHRWANVLPAMRDIYVPVWELRRRIHTLRVVEALRDYASRNDGALPKSLDEIHETPIPNDIVTGKPFQYRWESGEAFLSAPGINETRPGVRLHIRVR